MRMFRRAAIAALACLSLSACVERGLVYGERTGLNLAVRSDTATSAPLEVNVGLQRRVMGFVPPEGRDASGNPRGEAVNMISRFDMDREAGSAGPFDSTVRIGTSFVSGAAATAVAGKVEVVQSITGTSTIPLTDNPDDRAIATKLFNYTGESVANAQTYLNLARARGMSIAAGGDPNSQAVGTIANQANVAGNRSIANFLNL